MRPSRTQLHEDYREFVASAAPFARSRLAGVVSAGFAVDSAAVCFAAPVASMMSAYSAEVYSGEACSEEAFAGPAESSAVD